jgi:hypothetical protein
VSDIVFHASWNKSSGIFRSATAVWLTPDKAKDRYSGLRTRRFFIFLAPLKNGLMRKSSKIRSVRRAIPPELHGRVSGSNEAYQVDWQSRREGTPPGRSVLSPCYRSIVCASQVKLLGFLGASRLAFSRGKGWSREVQVEIGGE